MKYLTMTFLLMSFSVFAQDKEGDLQLPVSDISQIEKQEDVPPTIDEIEMEQEEPEEAQSKNVESKTHDTSKAKSRNSF